MKKIFISQSGQEWNRYANGSNEEAGMGRVANELVKYLKDNFEVEVIRNNPSQGLNDYTTQANKAGCHAYYSLHSNAGGGTGAEVLVQAGKNKSKQTIDRSRDMGLAILSCLVNNLGRKSRGLKTRLNSIGTDYFAELRQPNMPAVIIEVEFHDNVTGANWITNNTKTIGVNLAKCIAQFEELPPKKTATATVPKASATASTIKRKFKIGDRVRVSGVLYVDSFGSKAGSRVSKLVTTIGIVASSAKATRPYNIGDKMGWVAESDIAAYSPTPGVLRVGSKVKIKPTAVKYLTGQVIPKHVKSATYSVKQLGTAKYPNGVLLAGIMSWVRREDLDIV